MSTETPTPATDSYPVEPEPTPAIRSQAVESPASAGVGHRLTPTQWGGLLGVEVLDPDGWRYDGLSWTVPITKDDYLRRAAMSTVRLERDLP